MATTASSPAENIRKQIIFIIIIFLFIILYNLGLVYIVFTFTGISYDKIQLNDWMAEIWTGDDNFRPCFAGNTAAVKLVGKMSKVENKTELVNKNVLLKNI